MLRSMYRLFGLIGALAVTGAVVFVARQRQSESARIAKLEEEKQALVQIVRRLSDEKRVAELLVTDQRTEGGVLYTQLLFVEYTKGGVSLPPRSFTIEGKTAHLDAMVIKFDRHFVTEGDALRGHSIALFTRIYGDSQTPGGAQFIDPPGKIPDVYRDADPKVAAFEQDLWQSFWRLADDPKFRTEKGVRVAMGQGIWGMFEPGKLYTITLESDGGLNLTSEPLKGIYREAMKPHGMS
ncbi:MAG: hypothetical protein ACREJC_21135 [Tepidisphaeraceae bacterium]